MKTYIYIHVCCINNWKTVFEHLYNTIKQSGLYDVVDNIFCNILTPELSLAQHPLFADPKIHILEINTNISLFETHTINHLHTHAQMGEDFRVLYLHTKGVNHNSRLTVAQWVDVMLYFNVTQYTTCLQLLQNGYDTVGINLYYGNQHTTHYSGNFWWTTSSYLRKLSPCVHTFYNAPEFWLTERKLGKYACLWETGVDHYQTEYPAELYVGKPFSSTTPTAR